MVKRATKSAIAKAGNVPAGDASAAPAREWRVKKVVRLLVFCTGVCLVGAGLAARSAYGDVTQSALSLGRELGKMGDVGKTRPLRLNGQSIYIASTTDPAPLKAVLDKMEDTCRKRSTSLFKELDDLTAEVKKDLPGGPDGAEAAGIVRREEGDSGYVACFARDAEERPSLGDVVKRLTSVIETGELSHLGKLRYMFGQRKANGETHVIAIWTDGPFNVYSLFPQNEGDSPGVDMKDAPRPPNATRLLTADIEGVPYGIRMYDAVATPADILATYDQAMAGFGWEPVLTPPGDAAEYRVFHRDGADLMVFMDRDDDHTVVSLVETRSR